MGLKHQITMLMFIITCFWRSLKLLVYLLIKKRTNSLQGTKEQLKTGDARVEFIEHEPKIDGEAKDTILMLHGFPDDPSLWNDTVETLTNAGYRCIVAAFPASRGESLSSLPHLRDILDQVRDFAKGRGKITIMGFDWGAFVSNTIIRENPELFKRAIIVDVGVLKLPMFSITTWCIIAYQTALALCYMMGGEVGLSVLKQMLTDFRYAARPLQQITTDMTFWYRMILPLFFKNNKKVLDTSDNNLTMPTLFAYGNKKLFMFHSEDWLKKVQRSPCGRVVGFNADHWFIMWKSDEWKMLCLEWLEETKQYAKAAVSS